jgi:glycerol-3-phosphate acyltransferase PlsY
LWVRVPPPAPVEKMMPWLVILLGYLLGAIPTAYLAGHMIKHIDIRHVGDLNAGAANAYHHLGPKTGIIVGLVDAAKGALAVLIAQAWNMPAFVVLATGAAAVIGHNWPAFTGFRGGRGVSTTIGVFLVVITKPMLIVGGPAILALLIRKNVTLACAILFISLPLACWWLGNPPSIISYSIALPGLIGFTHLIRTRRRVPRHA